MKNLTIAALAFSLTPLCHANTYEDIHMPSLCKIGITSILTGIFVPLAISALKTDDLKLACVYSGLAALTGYLTVLQHCELMEDRRIWHTQIMDADHLFNQKMDHIHTRHYLNDIAKYMMGRLEEIAQKSI